MNKESKNTEVTKEWPQILAILSAATSAFSCAIFFAWTSPSIPIIIKDSSYNIDLESASYFTVIPPIVTILASPIYAKCVDRFGRKYSLLSLAVLHLLAWITIMFATSIYEFYLSRIFFGISDAAMFGVLPVYIAEVATPKVRGSWGNAISIFIYLGQFAVNVIGYFYSIKTTAYIFATVPIFFFLTFMLMPETPYYFIMKNQPEKAKESLRWLRRMNDVDAMYDQLTLDVQKQLSESGSYKDIFVIATNRNALLISALARGIQQFSGITAFAVYTQYIFQEAGQKIDKGYSSMLYTGILTICNLFGSFFIDKLGRKMSMVISCLGCSVVLFAEGAYFYFKDELSHMSWFPIAGMIVYVVVFAIGLGLVPILLLSELFSTSVRGKATSIMAIVFSVLVSVITKLFQFLMSNFGMHVPFALFAVCTFISSILSYFVIPETKGKTLEEIQQLLQGKKS